MDGIPLCQYLVLRRIQFALWLYAKILDRPVWCRWRYCVSTLFIFFFNKWNDVKTKDAQNTLWEQGKMIKNWKQEQFGWQWTCVVWPVVILTPDNGSCVAWMTRIEMSKNGVDMWPIAYSHTRTHTHTQTWMGSLVVVFICWRKNLRQHKNRQLKRIRCTRKITERNKKKFKMTFWAKIYDSDRVCIVFDGKYARKCVSCEGCLRHSHVTVDAAVLSLALWINMRLNVSVCLCFVFAEFTHGQRHRFHIYKNTDRTEWANAMSHICTHTLTLECITNTDIRTVSRSQQRTK